MRKTIMIGMGLLLTSISYALDPTFFPSGLATYGDARELLVATNTTSGVHANGDVWVEGDLNVAGRINSLNANGLDIKRDIFIDLPAKSTNYFTASLSKVEISTNILETGTSTFYIASREQPRFARNVTAAFVVEFTTNNVYANITFTGYNAKHEAITEVVIATNGATNASNNAFLYVTSYKVGPATFSSDSTDIAAGTIEGAPAGKICLNIGNHDKIGIFGNVEDSSDIIGMTVVNASAVETDDCTFDYTYDTWVHSDVPDGTDDYVLTYILH